MNIFLGEKQTVQEQEDFKPKVVESSFSAVTAQFIKHK